MPTNLPIIAPPVVTPRMRSGSNPRELKPGLTVFSKKLAMSWNINRTTFAFPPTLEEWACDIGLIFKQEHLQLRFPIKVQLS